MDLSLHEDETRHVLEFTERYKDFFERPGIGRLMRLYQYEEYRETNRFGVRLWNWIVALRMDQMIIRLMGD